MKRFHVHVAVNELAQSVRFYCAVFGAEPSVLKDDYAKWMLEDPRINFAISKRGQKPGVDHLGLQVEDEGELHDMRGRLETADGSLIEQTAQPCCYAKSDKYWITDPQGIAWETFHTLESIPMFGEDTHLPSAESACCIPVAQITRKGSDKSAACCVPTLTNAASGSSTCCWRQVSRTQRTGARVTERIYNVLFLCTGNSARSIMAQVLLNRLGGARAWPLDFVFTVCDKAASEICPVWPGQPMSPHWGIEDPAAVQGDAIQQRRAFALAFSTLQRRISLFLSLPMAKLDAMALQRELQDIGQTPAPDQ